jgi:hypothetical protein
MGSVRSQCATLVGLWMASAARSILGSRRTTVKPGIIVDARCRFLSNFTCHLKQLSSYSCPSKIQRNAAVSGYCYLETRERKVALSGSNPQSKYHRASVTLSNASYLISTLTLPLHHPHSTVPFANQDVDTGFTVRLRQCLRWGKDKEKLSNFSATPWRQRSAAASEAP